jgi:hypothetical protein
VASDSYKVYQLPAESPNHTSPTPPSDGRVTVTNPADATASPYGWHDTDGATGAEYTIMRGNNVHAYDDAANVNHAPTTEPDCGGSLACTFALDLAQAPSTYTSAAVANLFYLNNVFHDIHYQYGFTEPGGNFQANNYGRGGTAGDDVQAEAQDGGGTNNANFGTPPDGQKPRMQMYLWTAAVPSLDGDFDAGIVAHEYGHGVSNRVVGGPSNTSCLGNRQQPGEGLSDWWALAFTARPGDTGAMARTMGTYVEAQSTAGAGIRRKPYSTDSSVNNYTYATVGTSSEVHNLGEVWTEAAWRVYWALVTQYGFDANLYNASGNAGNQRALLYILAGLQNTVCSPAFTDVRDGIIQAATDNHGGADVCTIWTAFAAYGLGVDAISGGSNGVNPINGFAVPVSCGGTPVAPTIAIHPVSVEGSSGLSTQFSLIAGGSPVPTYQWQVSPYVGASWSNLTNSSTYSGATTATLTVNIGSGFNGYQYRCAAQNSAGSATSGVATLTLANSSYNSTLKAPECAATAASCSSGLLVNGKGTMDGGVEANQPNTIANACSDGFGVYHSDESLDKLKVSSVNGGALAEGKAAKIEATVYVYSIYGDFLDLYYSATANSPNWQFLTTVSPTAPGLQTLSATYTLPIGGQQAIRGTFRYLGSAAVCGTNSGWDDHDDLVFAVVTFTDDPLSAGIAIKAVHITELRTRIDAVRAAWNLPAYAWTDASIAEQSTVSRAAHIQELRDALNAAYDAAGRTRPTYIDPNLVAQSTMIKAVHITELRNAVKAIE